MELFQKVFFETIWHDQTDTQDSQVRNATAASAELPTKNEFVQMLVHLAFSVLSGAVFHAQK